MAPFFKSGFHDGRTDRYEQCFDPLWRKIFLRKRYSIGMCRNHYEDQYDLFWRLILVFLKDYSQLSVITMVQES